MYDADNTIFINLAGAQTLVKILQVGLIGIIAIYVFYAFLVTRQVKLMNNSFSTPLSRVFSLTAFIHLVASLVILLLTIATL